MPQLMATLRDYVRSFLAFASGRLASTAVLILLAAVLEGVGVLAILPFLELFAGTEQSGLTKHFVEGLNYLGLETLQQQFVAILIGFLALVALRNLVVWARTLRLAALGQGYVDYVRIGLFEKMANADWSTIRRLEIHQGVHAITTDVQRLSAGTQRVLNAAVLAAIIITQLIAAALISAQLALGIVAIFAVALAVAPYILSRAHTLGERRTQRGRSMFDTLINFLTVLKLAKIHRQEAGYLQSFSDDVRSLRKEALSFTSQSAAISAGVQFGVALIMCAIIALGIFVLETNPLALTAILIILARTSGPLLNLLQSGQQMANLLPAYRALQELEARLVPESGVTSERRLEPSPRDRSEGQQPCAVECSSISYGYAGQAHSVIRNLDLSIRPGQMVVLKGHSGAGKTTLLDLITGLIEPSGGEVTIDGRPSSAGTSTAKISYAPQDPVLLDRSIAENLRWGNGDCSEDELLAALDIAQARSFVEAMPDGLQSRVGERGQNLSGGERQRICLARALLRKPGLLILDEATSAIDQATEARILSTLKEQSTKMTILFVTHRPIDSAHLDQIYEMDAGAISAV